jgi:hypothetical protein
VKQQPDFLDRFWSKVDRRGPDDCWEWTGARAAKGYGRMATHTKGRQAAIGAHRFSYLIHFGPIPPGLFACHTCDNPPCVNPAHLWAGTVQENADDMMAKGRWRPGVHPPQPYRPHGKLSARVGAIRTEYFAGDTQVQLAERYHVSQVSVSKIVRGETYRSGEVLPEPRVIAEARRARRVAQGVRQHSYGTHTNLCPKGHPKTPENVRVSRGWNLCRVCEHDRRVRRESAS